MTGEDMIIQAAARLLSRASSAEHLDLRLAFEIAARCPACGAPSEGCAAYQRHHRLRLPRSRSYYPTNPSLGLVMPCI